MILTNKQQQFLDAVEAGKNVFLTGKAGTGKTTVVKAAIEILKKKNISVIALAPTGIAAMNIEGVTIHSQFCLPVGGVLDYNDCRYMKSNRRDVLSNATAYIIDEVSMLRPDVLDAMHYTLRKNGLPGLTNKQIIFIGDLKQLPPVINDNTKSVLYQKYTGETFMHAEIFDRLNVSTIELDEIMRQSNPDFINALNIIRDGGKSEYFRQFVHPDPLGIILASTNATVEWYNNKGLSEQDGDLHILNAAISGDVRPSDFTLEPIIYAKSGCKIMHLVNKPDTELRNGTLGTLIIKEGNFFIKVGNIEYKMDQVEVFKREYVYNKEDDCLELKNIGSITQYPFKLAYALTIHKAQGLTFDEMTIDLSVPCRIPGQLYVALSRVRTPEGLRIIVNR